MSRSVFNPLYGNNASFNIVEVNHLPHTDCPIWGDWGQMRHFESTGRDWFDGFNGNVGWSGTNGFGHPDPRWGHVANGGQHFRWVWCTYGHAGDAGGLVPGLGGWLEEHFSHLARWTVVVLTSSFGITETKILRRSCKFLVPQQMVVNWENEVIEQLTFNEQWMGRAPLRGAKTKCGIFYKCNVFHHIALRVAQGGLTLNGVCQKNVGSQSGWHLTNADHDNYNGWF